MIAVNVTHSIKPVEVEGMSYSLKKGDSAFIPAKLAGAMIKRGWAAEIPKPKRLGEVEGAEVRDVSRWVKGISGEQINKLKFGKNGLAISFIDDENITAGKVFTPFESSVNNSAKECGFSAVRTAKIFGAFRRGNNARLWWKEGENPNLYIKESVGNLSWRHKLPNLEEAAKMPNLKKILPATVKIDIAGLSALKKQKAERVAFVYFKDKAAIFVVDSSEEPVYIGDVDTICKSEGIAVYDLKHIVKVLKGVKTGFVRVEENRAAKFVVQVGRRSKAVIFVAAIIDADLRARIAAIAAKEGSVEADMKKLSDELKEEEVINGTAPRVDENLRRERKKGKDNQAETNDWAIIKEGRVNNVQSSGYGRNVRLEQRGSFYRVVVEKGKEERERAIMIGFATDGEAVERYEWYTEVR